MTPPTPIRPENFPSLVAERLDDAGLRANVRRATEVSLTKRATVVADFDDWGRRRARAREIKSDILSHLDERLAQFDRTASANGTTVLYARDAAEARECILGIVRGHDAKRIVKSKSMVTEEIDLNRALEEADCDVVETDLGEYIVQLAGEPPSHITAPALHKSRGEIGRLFSEKLDIPYTDDPETLTSVARRVLRNRFLDADVGISGVNFAVAETGTLCIVENEGNGRMSTTLPPVHIAVTGIEKLVPDIPALALFLSLLARSATGQRTTSYTSLISGPRRPGEWDGPEKLYVLFVDNGRTSLLDDPDLRESLACIRCGACMNICPVYRLVGGHAYGSMYSGPIGTVISPAFFGLDRAKHLPYASSLCGACSEICPVGIDIHRLILHRREEIVRSKFHAPLERWGMRAFAWLMSHPRRYRTAVWIASFIAAGLAGDRGSVRVPVWSRDRAFPQPARKSFTRLWMERYGSA